MKNTALFILISFVVGALIGFGVDRLVLRNKRASEEQKMEEQASEMIKEGDLMEKKDEMMGPVAMMSEPAGKNIIAVEDQAPGREVQIKSVTVSGNSWVVIHDDADGKPGKILGAQRFDPGTYSNRSVELVNNGTTAEGKVYYAMVHADDGDKQFDYKIDVPIKDDQGNSIMARFTAIGTSATQ